MTSDNPSRCPTVNDTRVITDQGHMWLVCNWVNFGSASIMHIPKAAGESIRHFPYKTTTYYHDTF